MVSVMSSNPTEGNFLLKLFETLHVNSGLKCKYDLIVKNSILCKKVTCRDASVLALPSHFTTVLKKNIFHNYPILDFIFKVGV